MSEPLYQKLYDSLKHDIVSGRYRPGEQLPTEQEIAVSFGVSKITSKKALSMLASDGLLIRQKGRGTFVNTELPEPLARETLPQRALPKIGLIFPQINAHFGIAMVSAIADSCRGRADLLFALSHGDARKEENAIVQMLQAPVDGLIVFPGPFQFLNAHLLQMLIDKYPLVLIDQNIPSIAQTSIGTDNRGAIFLALDYILQHGHRNLCVLSPALSNNVLMERFDAVTAYSARTGVMFDQQLWLADTDELSPEHTDHLRIKIREHLLKHPEITAVLTFHYTAAVAVSLAAQEIGRAIGKDLAVLCFDSPQSDGETPPFTHILQDEEGIGRGAVDLLFALMKNPGNDPQNVRLPARLVEGNSFFSLDTVLPAKHRTDFL